MRISYNWLREYVEIEDFTPFEIAEILTRGGLEVEEIKQLLPEIEGVVVGEVLSVNPHPNAEKLTLCMVRGNHSPLSIVCGAKNVKPGDKVPLALAGAKLPGNLKIETIKIRGEWSYGMLCSESELGLGEDSTGIMVLPEDLRVGEDIVDALGLKDYILEIKVTPNRSDWLSIIGIAREMAALTNRKIRLPEWKVIEDGESIVELASVEVKAPELCWRYLGRVIMGTTIRPSPFWLKRRLESLGIRSINNIVDITNYCLLEWGQPLHAFDFDLLEEKKIIVKCANPGEKFITLDNVVRTLDSDALMICDGRRSVAIAGIMGGLNTEISENTVNLFLESALFNPVSIRKTSRKLSLSTESSQRFERGVDPDGVGVALDRAAYLILKMGGGRVARGRLEVSTPHVPVSPNVPLSIRKVNTLLGIELKKETIIDYLKRLEINLTKSDKDYLEFLPPSYRLDLRYPVDLIEEIARLYGYDNIPSHVSSLRSSFKKVNPFQIFESKLKKVLCYQGFQELITYSFISQKELEILNLSPSDYRIQVLKIRNPLSENQAVMRTTLIPGLLSAMRKNVYQKNYHMRLFEIGKVFIQSDKDLLPVEKRMLGGLISGLRGGETWNIPKEEVDFYDIKGYLENVLEEFNILKVHFVRPCSISFLHPGKSSHIYIGNEKLGFLGEVHPKVLSHYDVNQRVFIFEIDCDLLYQYSENPRYYKPLSKYPPVYRDIALIVPEDLNAEKIKEAIESYIPDLIKEVFLFDFYKGKPIPEGKKSLAFRIKYQAFDRTLTDEEINHLHSELASFLRRELGVEFRE